MIRVLKAINDAFLIAQLSNLDLLRMGKDQFNNAEINNCLATSK